MARWIGFFLIAAGILLGVHSFGMDTSVHAHAVGKIQNFSLASRQLIATFWAGVLFISGIVLCGCSVIADRIPIQQTEQSDSNQAVPLYYRLDPQLMGAAVLVVIVLGFVGWKTLT